MHIRINDQSSIATFIRDIDGLHDAILKEAHLVSPGFVDAEGNMHEDVAPHHLRMVFHSQCERCAFIELLCEDVSCLVLGAGGVLPGGATGKIDKGRVVIYLTKKHAQSQEPTPMIQASVMQYRILDRKGLSELPA